MAKQVEVRGSLKCTLNKGLLKALAISQLALASAIALFTTVIDPPSLINILIVLSVTAIEGISVSYVLHYLKNGCFT
ncbi:hypothetical protein [Vulcanisaeta sp. JCM 16161]|uniref:hypothetical protein n=1 Tax=Vulcanisaeta sp. JCM 16161 TaxID=1295372 RepID=UPI000B11B4B0|nr:hypothetical protein [Vulcanisaeta sp. JCM 16161]